MIRLKHVLFPALLFFVITGIATQVHSRQPDEFPKIVGVWTGTYPAAFPRSHSKYPDKSAIMEMELDVYKQEGHLVWALNRWRPQGQQEWFVEQTTGAFDQGDVTEFYMAEKEPQPVGWGATGIIRGKVEGDKINIVYQGIGNGITFSVVLEKKAE